MLTWDEAKRTLKVKYHFIVEMAVTGSHPDSRSRSVKHDIMLSKSPIHWRPMTKWRPLKYIYFFLDVIFALVPIPADWGLHLTMPTCLPDAILQSVSTIARGSRVGEHLAPSRNELITICYSLSNHLQKFGLKVVKMSKFYTYALHINCEKFIRITVA